MISIKDPTTLAEAFTDTVGTKSDIANLKTEVLWVEKSLRELCRAMKDCGDATSKQ